MSKEEDKLNVLVKVIGWLCGIAISSMITTWIGLTLLSKLGWLPL